ncbi:MAG: hypothetical protein ABI459_00560 [Deltaproteobacteria bacterium]
MKPIFLLLIAAAGLAACGPISPELAAQQCQDRARAATGPTGNVTIGISNRGPVLGGEIGITDDYLRGRDPQNVYDQCVRQKTGQGPIRPLDLG